MLTALPKWLALATALCVATATGRGQLPYLRAVDVRPDRATVVEAGALLATRMPHDGHTSISKVLSSIADVDEAAWAPAPRRWRYAPDTIYIALARVSVTEPGLYYVQAGYHDLVAAVLSRAGSALQQSTAGAARPLRERSFPHLTADPRAAIFPIDVPAAGDYQLLIAYRNPAGESIYATNTPLFVRLEPNAVFEVARGNHLLVAGAFVGGLLLLLLYHLASTYGQGARIDYVFAVLLLSMFAFLAYDHGLLELWLGERRVPSYLVYGISSLGLAALITFVEAAFAELRAGRPQARLLRGGAVALVTVGLGATALYALRDVGYFPTSTSLALVPTVFRIVATVVLAVFAVVTVREVRRSGGRSLSIITAGMVALTALIIVNVTQALVEPYAHVPIVAAYLAAIRPVFNYLISVGIVLMCLSFAVAVSQFRRQRQLARERQFHLRHAEQEQRALRAQMNPHFLFNSLNSIKGYVIQNDREAAATYLTKFSRLIRRVLEGSAASLVTLDQEFETLRLYLDLERLRANARFDYRIDIAPDVDTFEVRIPPALLQPFVENAVWHGVRNLEKRSGDIELLARRLRDGGVEVVIRDNGIGRAAARTRSVHGRKPHRSRGLEITAERVELLRELHGVDVQVETLDLVTANGEAGGTEVRMRIAA